MAVFGGTLWWSLQNTGLGGSSTLYRLIGPILMIIIIAVLMPVLGRWSGLRTVSISAALIMSNLSIGIMTANNDSSADQFSATDLHLSAVIGTRS